MSYSIFAHSRSRVAAVAFGLALLGGVSIPAYASINLTTSETSSLQTSLTAAIAAANGNAAAVEAAIAKAVEEAVATYGADAAGSITSSVISIAEGAGANGTEVGMGLAQASAQLETTNPSAAQAIASTLSNEGKTDEILAYQDSVTSLGYSQLASLAGQSATPTGETGGNAGGGGGATGGGFTGGTGGGGGGGCLNPSCTKL